jgi:hypothetical protein
MTSKPSIFYFASCGGSAPFLKNRLTNIRLAIVLETATTTVDSYCR